MSQRPPSHFSNPPGLKKELYTSCMEALDDVGWDYGFSISSYGVELGVRTSDLDIAEQLLNYLPLYSQPSDVKIVDRLFSVLTVDDKKSKQPRYNLYWDQMLFAKDVTMQNVQNTFNAIASLAVAELSEEKLFIHSGVVEWKGKAILIPGRSHSGKSTLVTELVKAGAVYYSDEYAVLDDEGNISPYPKPISLRHKLTKTQHDVSIESIGGNIGKQRLPVGLVLFTEYKAGARWQPQPLSIGNGLLQLLDNTHSAQRDPERAMQILKRVVETATILSSPRGEAKKIVPLILAEV